MHQMPGYQIAFPDSELRKKNLQTLQTQAHSLLTICEQIRFIYDDVVQLPDGEIKDSMTEKLIDAMIMGKKINARLVEYKKEVGKYSGASGAHLPRIAHMKERKRLRNERCV